MNRLAAKDSPFKAACLVDNVEFTIGDEDTDVINVGLSLLSPDGTPIDQVGAVHAYLSDDDDGSSVVATAPDTVAIGTDGLAIESVSNKLMLLVSEDDGSIDINIGKSGANTYYQSGADTYYLCVVMPDGRVIVSDAITFAA